MRVHPTETISQPVSILKHEAQARLHGIKNITAVNLGLLIRLWKLPYVGIS